MNSVDGKRPRIFSSMCFCLQLNARMFVAALSHYVVTLFLLFTRKFDTIVDNLFYTSLLVRLVAHSTFVFGTIDFVFVTQN